MKNSFFLPFILTLVLGSLPAHSERIGFSSEDWKMIKTDHFDIIFSAQQQDLGRYYASIAEVAYSNLSTVFSHRPDRVVLIVNDTTDISNGYATRIPYPHIMAYTVQINDHESLSEAGEWGKELITHELTHILQFEPALGVYRPIRPIFGSIVAPNLLMPLWWKEGMAVEMETQFSSQGRTRSYYQDAEIRAFVLDKKLFDYTLPQANEALPSWPYGSRPYLFGSIFWSQLVADSGTKGVDYLVSRQGERFPYTLEQPMRELVDRPFEAEYSKGLYEVYNNAQAQIAQLNTQPVSSLQPLNQVGQNSFSPSWSDPHHMLAYLEQVDGDTNLVVVDSTMKRLHLKRRPSDLISGLEFHPTEKKILYSKVDDLNSKYKFSDLYIYDLETQKSERLTTGARARDAHFSADGQKIVFISTFDGQSQIKIFDRVSQKIVQLANSGFDSRFQSPIFWTAEEILFSKRSSQGAQGLYSHNLRTSETTQLKLPFADIRFLRKKGTDLYFTSSENGVHNIYVSSDLKTARPITHTNTGIWSFDLDLEHQQVWATAMTSHGFHVSETKSRTDLNSLPHISSSIRNRYPAKKTETETHASHEKQNIEDYSAGEYLWPQYWIPYIASSTSSKGLYLQAQTSGHDPLHIHEYSLSANYETDIQKGGFSGIYTNSAFTLPFIVGTEVFHQTFGPNNEANIVEYKKSFVGLQPDIFSLNKKMTFELGYQFEQVDTITTRTQHLGPYAQTSYLDYSQNIFQISPEKGWGGLLRFEHNQAQQNTVTYNKALLNVAGYFSRWLPTHHVLTSRLNAVQTFESVSNRFGTSNNSQVLGPDSLIPQFVLRGYQPAQFYGRSLWTLNTEYRFPIQSIEKGSGTDAYFLKRLSGAFIVDGLATEGASFTENQTLQRRHLNETFWSSGAEVRLETTLGYVLPMNFVLGVYLPHSPLFASSLQTGLSVQIGGF